MLQEQEEHYAIITGALKAVAHPCRICILKSIATGELCVSDLQEILCCSQANVSQHLGIMRARGLVVRRRMGNKTRYYLRDERISDLLELAEALFAPVMNQQPIAQERLPEGSLDRRSALQTRADWNRARRLQRTAAPRPRIVLRRVAGRSEVV